MILQNLFSIIFLLSLTVHVRSQTCENTYPSNPCSSNAACSCMPFVFSEDIGICGISAVNCARLSPCDADYSCSGANQMCVLHSRCGSTPICYPMSMADARLCPPMPTTTAAATTASSSFFTTEGRATFESTTNNGYTDATGTCYTSGTNAPFDTTTNGFNENETATFFTSNTTDYYNTTNDTTSYPGNWTLSAYSSELTIYSPMNSTTNKHYELIQIRVNTSGEYRIRSISNMDTYACIYDDMNNSSGSTNSTGLTNLTDSTNCNDDYNGNQFQLNTYLEAGISYILNFTTYAPHVTGPYTIEVYGEDVVEFSRIDVEQETTTSFPTGQTGTESVTTDQSSIISVYSSSLSDSSPKYSQYSRYYEPINIMVNTSGFYTFRSEEILDGMGYLYRSYFNSSDESYNLIAHDDQSGGNNQFSFTVYLEASMSYVLVFATYGANVSGRFKIIASGPDTVEFTGVESFESTSSVPSIEFTTGSSIVISEYFSELTTDNKYFNRPLGPGGVFYYEAIEMKVKTLGFYTFIAQQNGSEFISANDSSISHGAIDTFGYLYKDSFFPESSSMNLCQADDDGAGNRQFRLMYTLETDKTYVLVFSTFHQNNTGSFSIKAMGPDSVTFTRLNI